MSGCIAPLSFPLPAHVAQAMWRGSALAAPCLPVVPSGHALLDAELPGHGWPCSSLTDILTPQATQAEWRLLAPALAHVAQQGGSVLLIGAPCPPHLPALAREGLIASRLIRIDASTLADRLWATEQALKAAACFSAVLSWLPNARSAQIRRLHACANRHSGLLFVFRPEQARHESSAAPLRLWLGVGSCPHPLQVQILKRRGPVLDRLLQLAHWPTGLAQLLPSSDPTPALTPTRTPAGTPAFVSRPPFVAPPDPAHAALDGLVARRLGAVPG